MRFLLPTCIAIAAGVTAACAESDPDTATAGDRPAASAAGENGAPPAQTAASGPKVIARGLGIPWEIAFLPGGKALATIRDNAAILSIAKPGAKPRFVRRVPGVDHGTSEGGLLGLAVSPTYRRDKLIYVYYTTRRDNRVARMRLGGKPRVILKGLRRGQIHNGGRIAFGPDRKLYVGTGEIGQPSLAQNRRSPNGKILRINANGSVPRDNPVRGSKVWTLGHRNVQGLAWDRGRRLWASELGQDRFDELNLIRKGRNYGWPRVEGKGTGGGRFVSPLETWSTSQASPSGLEIARGNAYMAALGGQGIWRVKLNGARTGARKKLFGGRFGRIRTVAKAPDGSLWFSTSNADGKDRIVRFRP